MFSLSQRFGFSQTIDFGKCFKLLQNVQFWLNVWLLPNIGILKNTALVILCWKSDFKKLQNVCLKLKLKAQYLTKNFGGRRQKPDIVESFGFSQIFWPLVDQWTSESDKTLQNACLKLPRFYGSTNCMPWLLHSQKSMTTSVICQVW